LALADPSLTVRSLMGVIDGRYKRLELDCSSALIILATETRLPEFPRLKNNLIVLRHALALNRAASTGSH
jgi:hypothetical protein